MTTRNLLLPPVMIDLAGRRLSESEMGTLGEIRVQQRLSLPALCELSFFDAPTPNSPLSSVVAGLTAQVSLQGDPEPLFTGEITSLEFGYEPARGRTWRVRSYDRLHRLRKRQPVRTHTQVDLAGLARELVQDLGFTVETPSSGVLWRHLIQHGQNDLEFLTQRAVECGLYFTLRGNALRFLTLEGEGEPESLTLGESLLEARIEVNGDGSCDEVSTAGWDPLRVETHAGRAAAARVGREISARVQPNWIEAAVERFLVSEAVQDDRHAEALAQAELDLRAAREVTLWGVVEGNARLRPGARIELAGAAAELAGRYVLTEVTHVLDSEHRFVTEIGTRPLSPTPRPRSASIMLGVVTRVNDTDHQGRVKVSLPACADLETDWMQVLTTAAGADKGLIALPDVGDQVLLLCAQEDPAQGIVLGGLYGVRGAPDSGVEGESVKRFTFLTPGGQRVRMDDQKKLVRVENSSGSYVELAPSEVALYAAANLRIEAPGHDIAIRGKAIKFEEA
jgi:phage baseplate assembly protein V